MFSLSGVWEVWELLSNYLDRLCWLLELCRVIIEMFPQNPRHQRSVLINNNIHLHVLPPAAVAVPHCNGRKVHTFQIRTSNAIGNNASGTRSSSLSRALQFVQTTAWVAMFIVQQVFHYQSGCKAMYRLAPQTTQCQMTRFAPIPVLLLLRCRWISSACNSSTFDHLCEMNGWLVAFVTGAGMWSYVDCNPCTKRGPTRMGRNGEIPI